MGAGAAARQRARRATRNLGSRAQAGADQVRHREIARLHRRLSDLTMVPRRAFIDNVLLSRQAAPAGGDLVECGTWRGGLSAAMAWALPGRHSVLFDSFEGLPDAQPIDGPDAVPRPRPDPGDPDPPGPPDPHWHPGGVVSTRTAGLAAGRGRAGSGGCALARGGRVAGPR